MYTEISGMSGSRRLLLLKFPLSIIDIFVQWEIRKTKAILCLSVCLMIGMLLRANECIFV